ncbi:hypothetical protein [Streptomyces griseoflavus]|uniref:hypothetical protein n=1 Tax=Streptomyces griseoflavus TaxID=35619 RepID=UPI0033FEF418
MSDASKSKPALKRCAVCRNSVARKKLVLTAGGQPVHRACRTSADRLPGRSATPSGITRAPKDISRDEMLRRIAALRKGDAKAQPKPGAVTKPGAPKKRGTAKVPPARRPKPPVTSHRGTQASRPPQPYYGVEMKFIDGRWVQMHPDSE